MNKIFVFNSSKFEEEFAIIRCKELKVVPNFTMQHIFTQQVIGFLIHKRDNCRVSDM